MNFQELKGKVALVTGGAQGIGRILVESLAIQGVKVAVVDYNEEQLNLQVKRFKEQGFEVFAFPADVGDSMAIDAIVDTVESEIGPIEMLVNVAGILSSGPIQTFSNQDWARTFSINTTGVFNVSRAISRYMIPREKGSIVTVGSNAASVPRISMAAYAASKAATVMFTKCLGLELAEHGIRCNIVSPGSTDTDMQRSLWTDDNGAEMMIKGIPESFKVGIPLKKIAQPQNIVDAILFFLSDQSSHITMSNLVVDGGATLGAS
ncbi:2,3-dihydro-2,3-dihydroxybenzoate dehydrogenase [Solibacillus merdavium]|uniref:2,3-dihydro-2,3-dihydroxybenzoate dehydrogenase n=1 Tax=Solibacillus merdavium TaxID=2762218 RepID=A0ABR8XML7_9BACL|nr:2,3-dihydro-2,3-dihydroxybenzoate dehydrogenase [Solibacillus merdavium]MBD8033175.1 2,3-dihydro-2,3-dihydroxybenzoate dehydrogenase [Solibacillus merdavium]